MREKIMVDVLAEEKAAKEEVASLEVALTNEFEVKQKELDNSYNKKFETLSSEKSSEKESLVKTLQSTFKRKNSAQSKKLSLYDEISSKQIDTIAKKVLLLISK